MAKNERIKLRVVHRTQIFFLVGEFENLIVYFSRRLDFFKRNDGRNTRKLKGR